MFGMLSVLAELQREPIIANTNDGLAASRAREESVQEIATSSASRARPCTDTLTDRRPCRVSRSVQVRRPDPPPQLWSGTDDSRVDPSVQDPAPLPVTSCCCSVRPSVTFGSDVRQGPCPSARFWPPEEPDVGTHLILSGQARAARC